MLRADRQKIIALFACPTVPKSAARIDHGSDLDLSQFVMVLIHRTQLPGTVAAGALLLLERIKRRHPRSRASSGHRLFISAFMVASKILSDHTYSNETWVSAAGNMFQLKEINQMEREFCGHLSWSLALNIEDIFELSTRLSDSTGLKSIP